MRYAKILGVLFALAGAMPVAQAAYDLVILRNNTDGYLNMSVEGHTFGNQLFAHPHDHADYFWSELPQWCANPAHCTLQLLLDVKPDASGGVPYAHPFIMNYPQSTLTPIYSSEVKAGLTYQVYISALAKASTLTIEVNATRPHRGVA